MRRLVSSTPLTAVLCALVLGLLVPTAASAWVQPGTSFNDGVANEQFGNATALSDDGTVLLVGAQTGDGRAFSYIRAGSVWSAATTLTDGPLAGAFGHSVALSGDATVAAIGGMGSNEVRTYLRDGSTWDPRGTLSGFGSGIRSVALSYDGSVLVIGEASANANEGAARVYVWDGGAWLQRGTTLSGTAGSSFGGAVALSRDGTVLAIGAIGAGGLSQGTVEIFAWSGTSWVQRGSTIVGEGASDSSAWDLDLSDDGRVVAIGAPDNGSSNNGHVRVFEWSGSAWLQRGADIEGAASGDQAGTAVALSADGTVVAVGAPSAAGNGAGSGEVRVFTWNGTLWSQREDVLRGMAAGDKAGFSVALTADGSMVAVGAPDPTYGTRIGWVGVYLSPPAVPTGLSAQVLSGARARLSLVEDVVAGGVEATCTSTDGGAPVVASGEGSPVLVTGLTPASTYTCTARSSSVAGWSSASSASASFVSGYPLTVSVPSGSGAVVDDGGVIDCGSVCTGTAATGATVTLTAVPAGGWGFSGWGGACSGAERTCTITMSAARTATASFVLLPSTGATTLPGEAPGLAATGSAVRGRPATPAPIRWSSAARGKPLTARFAGESGATYRIAARNRGGGTARGACRAQVAGTVCTLRLRRAGQWLVTITPLRAGVSGTAAQRVIRIR